MRRSPSEFSRLRTELPAARSSSFVRCCGAIIPRKKPPGNEKKISVETTRTYLLANPNLEGEIHLKVGRFVTSQIFNLECFTILAKHLCIMFELSGIWNFRGILSYI